MNDGILTPEALAQHRPLELLRTIVGSETEQAPMGRTLGFRLTAVEEGRSTLEAIPDAAYRNPLGTVHGGWAASVLDTAMGCAVLASLAAGETFTTLELKVNFTRAIAADGPALAAVGSVVAKGRRVITAEARMTDAAGRIVAHATSTCLVLPLPAPPAG